MSQTVLVEEKERKVGGTGGSVVIYIPKEIKKHFKAGEPITVSAKREGKNLVIVVYKSLFNFDLEDVRSLAKEYKLTEKENRVIGDVQIFQVEKNNILLSYTENILEELSPAYVTASFKWSNLDYDGYSTVSTYAKQLQKKFDVIVRPEGDLDTINLIKDPEYYKLNRKKAIKLLRKSGKKVGASITIRFNSKKNTLDEIKTVLNTLKKLNS